MGLEFLSWALSELHTCISNSQLAVSTWIPNRITSYICPRCFILAIPPLPRSPPHIPPQLLSFSIHSTTVPLGPQRLPFLINSSAGSIGLVLKVLFCFTYFSLSSLPPFVIRHPSFISCNNSLSGFTVLTPEFFSSISTQ